MIVPANTFIATFEAVSQAGGVPVPVDVSEDDYNLDPRAAEAAMEERDACPPSCRPLRPSCGHSRRPRLAVDKDLALLEDACQAHGASRDGFRVGTVGFAAAFSFYPGKNLGAAGDAGAVVTDDEELADRLRALREHGQWRKYEHRFEGFTARLDTVQAIVLLHKLRHLERWNEQRRAAARYYDEALTGVGDSVRPREPEGARHVWHLYVVRTVRRDGLAGHLQKNGIAHRPPLPGAAAPFGRDAHLAYGRGAFPVTERLAHEVLSLPMFPGITEQQLETVVSAIKAFFDGA